MERQLHTRQKTHTLRLIFALFLALVTPIALSGAAVAGGRGDHNTGPRTFTVLAGSQSSDLAIQSMAFLPSNVYVDAGDTVSWLANSAEPHTVTFLPPGAMLMPFNPADTSQVFAVGGASYNGVSYYNSGILTTAPDSGFPAVSSYSLTFPTAGDFTYYCVLHGMMMKGTVHVAQAGTPYPYSQSDYDHQAKKEAKKILHDGYKLWRTTARLADSEHVYTGADDGTAMVMRFIQPTVRVHVGDVVSFVNNGMGAPHTVTFGAEPANVFVPLGNPAAYAGGDLNSGFMPPGSTFTVTFTAAGTYSYLCGLHDFMGMVGQVVVLE
jgi:plastocyanin